MAVQNNGGEFQEYQSAQNQLLNIQAQQMQNLNEQRVMAQADASTNNVLYQASGLMADNMMNNTQEAANFNPQTQAILNQYGLGQPRMQRSSSSSSQSTSKQNITINNNYKTENTTTNNVTVPSGGPIQGRPVTIGDNGIGKFKVWLNTTFAQQQEAAAKRDREYEIRQANLSKDNNKILRKLETVGTNVGKALDPRRVTQAVQNPMKMLLTTLGIVTIAKNFPKIMKFVDKVQNFFEPDGKLVQLLGGKDGESVGEAFSRLLLDKDNGLISHLRLLFEQEGEKRRAAMKNVPMPDVDLWNDGIGGAVRTLGKYLTNIIGAIVDPGKSVENSASDRISKDVINTNSQEYREQHRTKGDSTLGGGVYDDYTTVDENGNERVVDRGDFAVVGGTYKGVPEYHLNINPDGSYTELTGTPGSTVSQSNDIVRLLGEAGKGNYVSSMAVVEGLSRLEKVLNTNKNREIVVSRDFIDQIKQFFNIEGELGKEAKSGDYLYVARKIRTRQEGEEPNRWMRGFGGIITKPIYDSIVNDERVELVNKNNILPWDKPLSKLPENLFVINQSDLQKITKAIIGENATDLSVKNTNSELQNAMLDYFKANFSNTNASDGLGLGTFNTHMMPIQAYQNLEEDQDTIRDQRWEENRGHQAAQKIKGDVKSVINKGVEIKENVIESYEERIKKSMDFFINKLGLTKEQAAGFVANLDKESTLKPDAKNGDAEGIAQWTNTGNRKSKLLDAFNKKYNKNYKSISEEMNLDEQLDMLGIELTEGDKSMFFKKYKEGEYAKLEPAEAVFRGFEFGGNGTLARPEQIHPDLEHTYDWHRSERIKSANTILAARYTPLVNPESAAFTGSTFNYTATPDMVSNPTVQIDYSKEFSQLHEDFIFTNKSLATMDENLVNGLNNLAANNDKGQTQVNITSAQSFTN